MYHVFSGDAFYTIPWIKAILSKGYLGLYLFFIISGFIIPFAMYQNRYSIMKFPVFLLKRICRIEPPYIISFLLIIGMRMYHCHHWGVPYVQNWPQLGLHFFYLNQYFGYESYTVVYWSLAIEFQFYLLVGILFPLILHKKKVVAIAVLVVFSIASWFLHLTYNFYIFQFGFLFVAGVLLFLFYINHIPRSIFFPLFIAVLMAIYFKNGFDILVTTVFAGMVIFNIQRTWKVSDFFGKISYSFYLVHAEAIGWLLLYTNDGKINDVVLRIRTILLAIAIATIFYYLFEKPALFLSKKIVYKEKGKLINKG